MTDTIILEELKVDCIIGIFDWEREQKQTVSIDLELAVDTRPAARSDMIDDAVDYKTIAKSIIAHVEESSYFLVERMAEKIAAICLEDRRVKRATVTVSKPGAVRGSKNVGVQITRPVEEQTIYLGVGGNIDPEENIAEGLTLIRERFNVTAVSATYRSPAWGVKEAQPDYLNLAVAATTSKDLFAVRAELRWIEELLGRKREIDKFAPRTLDIDLLLYGDTIVDDGRGQLPHPQLLTQPFVYVPMTEIVPDLIVPGTGKKLCEITPVYDDPSIQVTRL